VITRQEFGETLWPADIFVDFEQGISSAVMRLRDASPPVDVAWLSGIRGAAQCCLAIRPLRFI
jgi:hypothetical protein